MKLIFSLLLLACCIDAIGQDVSSARYLKEVHDFWADFDKSQLTTDSRRMLVAQYSFGYRDSNVKIINNAHPPLDWWQFLPPNVPLKGKDGTTYVGITLNTAEKKTAKKFFKNMPCIKWTSELLGEIDFISRKSIDSFETFITYPEDRKLGQISFRYYYLLSPPLFLRNNTVCLFYICRYGPSCESTTLWGCYMKKKDHWSLYTGLREGT